MFLRQFLLPCSRSMAITIALLTIVGCGRAGRDRQQAQRQEDHRQRSPSMSAVDDMMAEADAEETSQEAESPEPSQDLPVAVAPAAPATVRPHAIQPMTRRHIRGAESARRITGADPSPATVATAAPTATLREIPDAGLRVAAPAAAERHETAIAGLATAAPTSAERHATTSAERHATASAERHATASADMASEEPDTAVGGEPASRLPAGASHGGRGFATVRVFYATDRQRGPLALASYQITGQKQAFLGLTGLSLLTIVLAGMSSLRGRSSMALGSALLGGASGCLAAACVILGQAKIEKHGVTYGVDRGALTRGVCEVTVPDSHQRGMVERPSLLRLEFREDQQDHIVLTSAVELTADDFQKRLSETVDASPERDLLVFIHGYNVDFESAVRRTAQIAVDLPLEGVPVCYSWPSQGSLLGYSIDENNADWTVAHLKAFLLELARESGADSINVVAHSMGNRAMTAAMQQIGWQLDGQSPPPFDRVVLAAPDVDADRFRRDLAPSLLAVSNQVTLYASSDDQALVASKQVHGYPRAGESGDSIVVVPGIETVDVSGIDLSLLGHSYYGDNESMLRDLYEVVRARLPAAKRGMLVAQQAGPLTYWKLAHRQAARNLR